MLEIAYFIIFLGLVITFHLAIKRHSIETIEFKSSRPIWIYYIGVIAWVIYLYAISSDGFLFDKSMPPRFPIFVFLPILVFIVTLLYSIRNSRIFESMPPSWPIYFQSFRVIMEIVIYATFINGIMPVQATIQGYNYEMIFAITAPLVGYLTFSKPLLSKSFAIGWNILGILFLVTVVSIVVTSFFAPSLWGSEEELIDIRFTQLPILLLPAFIVPSAIFVHLFSIIQLVKLRRKSQKPGL